MIAEYVIMNTGLIVWRFLGNGGEMIPGEEWRWWRDWRAFWIHMTDYCMLRDPMAYERKLCRLAGAQVRKDSMRGKEAQVTHSSPAPIRLNAKPPFKSHHERSQAEVS